MTSQEWNVDVSQELAKELAESFQKGPIIIHEGKEVHYLTEELVAHLNGLKIEIFSNEHPPPHFRVKYSGEMANFTIKDCEKLNGGLDKWIRSIKKWHAKNKRELIAVWNDRRPSDCPVGEYRD